MTAAPPPLRATCGANGSSRLGGRTGSAPRCTGPVTRRPRMQERECAPPRPCRGPPEDAAGRPKTPLGACGQRTRRGSRAEPRLPVRDPARWAKLLPPDGRELGGRSARPPLRGLQEGRQRLLGEGSRKRVETKPRQGFAQRQRLLCLARLTSGIISPPKPHTGSIPLVSPSLYAQLSRQELGVKLWFC